MLKTSCAVALVVAAFTLTAVWLDGSSTPPLSPAQAAAAESRLDDFCGGRHWTNARWQSPMVDDKGRTRVRVTFDYSKQRVDATIVLIGDRVYAFILHLDGDTSAVSDWLRLTEQD